MFARRILAVLLLAVAPACASSATNAGSATAPRRDPNVISQAELQDPVVAGGDAMTAIRQLRPAFFRTRGPQSLRNTTAGLVQISQDYGPLHPVEQLSAIEVRSLKEVRYLSAVEAQSRFGITANGGPVIVLLTSSQ
jgi:hypothetical protein